MKESIIYSLKGFQIIFTKNIIIKILATLLDWSEEMSLEALPLLISHLCHLNFHSDPNMIQLSWDTLNKINQFPSVQLQIKKMLSSTNYQIEENILKILK